jgi:hypothetical protein
MIARPIEAKDLEKILSFGQSDFAAAIKDVKAHIKAPLADKQPIYALKFRRLGQIESEFVAEDVKGERLVLTDVGISEEPPSCHLLPLLPAELFENQTMIVRFRHDLDSRLLRIKPLGIVTTNGIIRLTL